MTGILRFMFKPLKRKQYVLSMELSQVVTCIVFKLNDELVEIVRSWTQTMEFVCLSLF
jgi:hypothetical protein